MPDTENNTNNNINNNTQEENLENNINSNTQEENLENTEENLENINNISNIKKELEEYKKYKELFLRTAAEYENFRKRSEKEKESIYSDALSYVISNIISIGDSIDSALNLNNNNNINNNTEENNNNYKTGIELLKNQFDASLKKLGVESFGEIGEKFDPDIHNAISHIEQEEVQDENVISSVFQKGYKTQTKVIRHAMVQVTN